MFWPVNLVIDYFILMRIKLQNYIDYVKYKFVMPQHMFGRERTNLCVCVVFS